MSEDDDERQPLEIDLTNDGKTDVGVFERFLGGRRRFEVVIDSPDYGVSINIAFSEAQTLLLLDRMKEALKVAREKRIRGENDWSGA